MEIENKNPNWLQSILATIKPESIQQAKQSSEDVVKQYGNNDAAGPRLNMIAYDDLV